MTAFICLVRGVNVGGHNRLPMPVFKDLCASLGGEDVQTYVQSGNAVFRSEAKDCPGLVLRLEKGIRAKAGIDVRVILRTAAELRKAIAANPFPAAASKDPSHLLIVFLGDKPTPAAARALIDAHKGPEEMRLIGRELYVNYGAELAKSKLTNTLIERKLGVTSTARNWNTATRLLEMAEGL